jgi:predicted metal-dependent phosphoesterase TrpH
MFADLHLHTRFSDGTWSPEELASQGRAHDLAALALTDHDTVEGCAPMAQACAAAGLEFIAGTELTAEQTGDEIHILGYGLEARDPRLLAEVAKFQAVRQDRIREMVMRLNRLRVPLAAEAVFALANCRAPGRPHVARALVKAGLCSNLDEAFERFLKKNRPAWVPKFKMSAAEAIALIHQAGGVAVLAHPGLNRTDNVIRGVVEAGLDGLECFHTKHSSGAVRHYLEVAARFHLLVTGGSDCHGVSKGAPLIGTVKLPYRYVEELKGKIRERKAVVANPPWGVHTPG